MLFRSLSYRICSVKDDDAFAEKDHTEIPGLAKFQSLLLSGGTLQWEWCRLKDLDSLHLGRFCQLMRYDSAADKKCHIHNLVLERGTGILDTSSMERGILRDFLACLPELRDLGIALFNEMWDGDEGMALLSAHCRGGFGALIQSLTPGDTRSADSCHQRWHRPPA
jgi:hypothetical protein